MQQKPAADQTRKKSKLRLRPGPRPRLRPRPRLVACLTVVLLVVLSLASVASAHSGQDSYLYLDVTENSVSGRAEYPIADLGIALGVELDGEDDVLEAALLANRAAIHDYADDHLDIGPEGSSWDIEFGEPSLFYSDLPEVDDNYIILPFEVLVGGQAVPRQFDLKFDPFFTEIPGRSSLLLISNDWQGGVIENGHEELTTFDDGSRTQLIDLGDKSIFKNFMASVKLGVKHIQTGPDHILFVLVLLLPSVLVFNNRWHPTDRFATSLWRVLKVVTMFTVAHSITFTLAGIGVLPLPSPRIVESIIALSIAAAALHNIRPIAANREWVISFAFGLFHGMGFASLVSGLDVSRGTQLVSLFGRNVGIEIGQAVVVLLLFPMLYLLRRTVAYRPLFIGASLLLTLVALAWTVERLFEIEVGADTLVDPVFVWPRVLFYIAGVTLAAGAYFMVERSGERLLPTVGSDGVEKSPAEATKTEATVGL